MPAACRTYKVAGEPASLENGRVGRAYIQTIFLNNPTCRNCTERAPTGSSLISGSAAATSGIAAGISQQYDRRPGTSGDGCPSLSGAQSPVREWLQALSTESNTVIAEPAGWNDWSGAECLDCTAAIPNDWAKSVSYLLFSCPSCIRRNRLDFGVFPTGS